MIKARKCQAGAAQVLYGAPIIPGAMTLLVHIGPVQVMGVPACALYFKTTSFDLLLPRLLAGLDLTRRDLAKLGHGAFCLECKSCTFPKRPSGNEVLGAARDVVRVQAGQ
jgi:formylmethanofuran dehydrogenase subunit E